MKIGEKIRHFRVEKNYSQEYLAEKLGMSTTGYAQIERGETDLKHSRLEEIAKILEVPIPAIEGWGEVNSYNIHHTQNHRSANVGHVIMGAIFILPTSDKWTTCLVGWRL